MCNDLEVLQSNKGYINANKQWREFYNACAVVPIAKPGSFENDDIIGFLCVYNFRGGFDNEFCVSILTSFSSTIFNVLIEQRYVNETISKITADHGQLSIQSSDKISDVQEYRMKRVGFCLKIGCEIQEEKSRLDCNMLPAGGVIDKLVVNDYRAHEQFINDLIALFKHDHSLGRT